MALFITAGAAVDQAEARGLVKSAAEFWLVVVSPGRDDKAAGIAMAADPDVIHKEALGRGAGVIGELLQVEKAGADEVSRQALQDIHRHGGAKPAGAHRGRGAHLQVIADCRGPVDEVGGHHPAAHAEGGRHVQVGGVLQVAHEIWRVDAVIVDDNDFPPGRLAQQGGNGLGGGAQIGAADDLHGFEAVQEGRHGVGRILALAEVRQIDDDARRGARFGASGSSASRQYGEGGWGSWSGSRGIPSGWGFAPRTHRVRQGRSGPA